MAKIKYYYLNLNPIIEYEGYRFCAIEIKKRMNYLLFEIVDEDAEIEAYMKETIKEYLNEK